jgi:hypothetical protein
MPGEAGLGGGGSDDRGETHLLHCLCPSLVAVDLIHVLNPLLPCVPDSLEELQQSSSPRQTTSSESLSHSTPGTSPCGSEGPCKMKLPSSFLLSLCAVSCVFVFFHIVVTIKVAKLIWMFPPLPAFGLL